MSGRRPVVLRAIVCLCAIAFTGVAAACQRDPEQPKTEPPALVRAFSLPTADSGPQGIASGPDGAIWFTERKANRIGRITTTGQYAISEYTLPNPGSGPYAITAGPDGKLWFTEHPGDRIGWIDPRSPGRISELLVPTSESWTRAVTAGPDGNVWFAERASRVGRVVVRPTPTIDDFLLPRAGTQANDIAASGDGNLWYAADKGVVGRVLAVWPESVQEIQLRDTKADVARIVAAPDGNLWVVQASADTIARIGRTPPHAVTELRLPGPAAEPKALAVSPGYVWLARSLGGILRIEIAKPHRIREVPLPASIGSPEGMTLGPDGNVWFTAPATNSIGRISVRELATDDETLSAAAVVSAEYEAASGPVPQGDVIVTAAARCTVSIDGVEMFRLDAGQNVGIPLRVGRHIVSAVSPTGPERWEKPIDVVSGDHLVVAVALKPEPTLPTPFGFSPTVPQIEFVRVAPGEFLMGSEAGAKDERPPHRVRLTQPFEMGRYEVSQAEWAAVMGPIGVDQSGPEWFTKKPRMRYLDVDAKAPVMGASWEDAQEFIEKLNALDGRYLYRLPTEAEWEYACRAGTTVELPANIDEMAWHQGSHELRYQPVGTKKPNAWGLHDMHGNAQEWVADWYDKDYYRKTPAVDPPGPASGRARVYRGSDVWNRPLDTRCANRQRGGAAPTARVAGFRLVRQPRRAE